MSNTENTNTEVKENKAEEVKVKVKPMKTIANCTPKEFASQTLIIASRIKKYVTDVKELKKAAEGKTDVFEILNYICGGNIDETMEICGVLCFMSGEKFANLEPDEDGNNDGIAALADIMKSKRCIGFFTSVLQIQTFTKHL